MNKSLFIKTADRIFPAGGFDKLEFARENDGGFCGLSILPIPAAVAKALPAAAA